MILWLSKVEFKVKFLSTECAVAFKNNHNNVLLIWEHVTCFVIHHWLIDMFTVARGNALPWINFCQHTLFQGYTLHSSEKILGCFVCIWSQNWLDMTINMGKILANLLFPVSKPKSHKKWGFTFLIVCTELPVPAAFEIIVGLFLYFQSIFAVQINER